jgi:AcrR family transcriptional regulator
MRYPNQQNAALVAEPSSQQNGVIFSAQCRQTDFFTHLTNRNACFIGCGSSRSTNTDFCTGIPRMSGHDIINTVGRVLPKARKPKMGTPAQLAQSETARRRIVEAAGVVFAAKGFQASTVREICQLAEVNIAAISYYFEDKASLYREILRVAAEQEIQAYPLPKWTPDTLPATRLHDLILVVMRRLGGVGQGMWQSRLIVRELLQPTEFCPELSQNHFRPHFELMLGILDEILPATTPAHARLQTAQSIFGQCISFRVTSEASRLVLGDEAMSSHYSPEDLAKHITQFTLAALGLGAPLGVSPNAGANLRPFFETTPASHLATQ